MRNDCSVIAESIFAIIQKYTKTLNFCERGIKMLEIFHSKNCLPVVETKHNAVYLTTRGFVAHCSSALFFLCSAPAVASHRVTRNSRFRRCNNLPIRHISEPWKILQPTRCWPQNDACRGLGCSLWYVRKLIKGLGQTHKYAQHLSFKRLGTVSYCLADSNVFKIA